MNIKILYYQLIKPTFWFLPPQSDSWELRVYFVIFLTLAIGAIICYILFTKYAKQVKPYEKIRSLTFNWLIGFSIAGLFFTFLAWQMIPYVSSRIFFILLFLTIIIWMIYVLIYIRTGFAQELKGYWASENFKKYLPKAKEKK
ncbi:MAG: hypothetical protein M1338_01275 [Patescibacteria group bacterium]|nr:hypothetical protein [Patescibacteria group bacterium]